jgi:hypothetical protein
VRVRSGWQGIRRSRQLPGMWHDLGPEARRSWRAAGQSGGRSGRKTGRGAIAGRQTDAARWANSATVKVGGRLAILP